LPQSPEIGAAASWPQVKPLGYNLGVRLKVVLEPSDEGGFTAYVPSLPSCISEGDNAEEAMANLHEAIELYLEPVQEDLPRNRISL